jgi:predicted O-methyltransferase YrrM
MDEMDKHFAFTDSELRIGDLVFRLGADFAWDEWRSAPEDCFLMFKTQGLLEKFDAFFASKRDLRPQNILEIGIWDGGSTAYWFEYFKPQKIIAIDHLDREDSEYFRAYVESRGVSDRVKTYWGVDQKDSRRLHEIVGNEFQEPIDVVIDDGSHMPEETKSSFETLYPLLRPGGFYVIEDWNWELMPEARSPDHPWASADGLVGLVTDLLRLTGAHVIPTMTIYTNFVGIEKDVGLNGSSFDVDAQVASLPQRLEPLDAARPGAGTESDLHSVTGGP